VDDCPPPPLPAADPPPFPPPVTEEEENDTASALGFVYADSQASTAAAVRPLLRQQQLVRPPPLPPEVLVVPLVWAPGMGGAVRMTVAAGEISRLACEQAAAIFDSWDTVWSENSNIPDSLVPQLEAIQQQMHVLQMQVITLHRTLCG
jgi:hypothetical protein